MNDYNDYERLPIPDDTDILTKADEWLLPGQNQRRRIAHADGMPGAICELYDEHSIVWRTYGQQRLLSFVWTSNHRDVIVKPAADGEIPSAGLGERNVLSKVSASDDWVMFDVVYDFEAATLVCSPDD